MPPSLTQPRFLKRFRMEIDLSKPVAEPALPDGYHLVPWHPAHLERHAAVKYQSFRNEIDSDLFLSLATEPGCRDLMRGIVTHSGFLPQATWLIEFRGNEFAPNQACGTIQGIVQNGLKGAIQNVAVAPEHRGFGLGRALLLQSLAGFRMAGMTRVYLDVTAENRKAVQLYRSLGFQHKQTSYREMPTISVDVANL